ncbi:unnamed protein product [Orchesella dallaii]|uniref:Transcription elongation regulator 1 n=1 Tax=Orchesella dallaii TaxID=48710 RepID=A0ABP1RDM1_9HEXA
MWPSNLNNHGGERSPTQAPPQRYFPNPQPGPTGLRPIGLNGAGFRGGFNRFNGGNNSSPTHRFKIKRHSPPPRRAFKSNSSERLCVTHCASNEGIIQFRFKPGTWVETPTPEGGCYYYHAESRETTWSIPMGPGINIVMHNNFRGGGVSGNQASTSAPPVGSTMPSSDVNLSQHASVVCLNPPVLMPQSLQIKSPECPSPIINPCPVPTATPPLPIMVPPPFSPFMMNHPWNPASHLPMPPFHFPPPHNPVIPFVSPSFVEPISTFTLQNTTDWSEHISPEGIRYYCNFKTGVSSWEKPETAIQTQEQHETSNSTTVEGKMQRKTKTSKSVKSSSGSIVKHKIDEATPTFGSIAGDSRKPVLCKHVVGASWCIVYTNDKKMFYFNPARKESVWERPAELYARNDVDELIRAGYEELIKKPEKPEVAEASSTTVSPPPSSICQPSRIQEQVKKVIEKSLRVKEEELESVVDVRENETGITEVESSEIKIETESSRMKDETESVKIQNTEAAINETVIDDKKPENVNTEIKPVSADASVLENSTTPMLSASEAVTIAMKERVTIPYDVRVQRFREMLLEKKVSAFSPWEKELRKIVFDPRYLLLTCKERKTVFDSFVKEIAEVELKDNKEKMGDAKEKFIEFIKEVNSDKLTYADFEKRFASDDRMKLIEKSKDRRDLFMEIIDENRRKQRKLEQLKSEELDSICVSKAKASFTEFLERKVHDYHLSWVEVYEDFKLGSDRRFQSLTGFEMGDLYRLHRSKLRDRKRRNSGEAERESKKTKKKKSRHSRKHKKSSSKHDTESSGCRRIGEGKGVGHKSQKRDHSTSESDRSRHSDGEIVSTSESE